MREHQRSDEGDRVSLLATSAQEARGAVERVLSVVGWPPYEHALSRAIDRLLQLEEAGQAERAETFFADWRRRDRFLRAYWAHRRGGANSTDAARRALEDLAPARGERA